jgi:ABC-type oligopeptide transport system ATPase subunit
MLFAKISPNQFKSSLMRLNENLQGHVIFFGEQIHCRYTKKKKLRQEHNLIY